MTRREKMERQYRAYTQGAISWRDCYYGIADAILLERIENGSDNRMMTDEILGLAERIACALRDVPRENRVAMISDLLDR